MDLAGVRVAVLVEDLYEDLELWYPVLRLREAGAEVKVVGPRAGETYKSKHGYPARADVGMDETQAASFDAVVIPGGYAPDRMRRHASMLDLVRSIHEAGKPVAFICHAGWVPISAGIVRGRTVTSVSAIRDDLVNAGANWVDREVVVDGNLVTSRTPADLPAFCRALVELLARVKVA
ncbi:MAG: type 1 glutamine amidotransferase domain-containing protein [Armatimonadota bacterium]|nr:type 1 glutamine amidotransferase domain-containing protein [Armatimonadota bacterium]MDR5696357.1 type 1 glutamine amidotransferase domain-containing protein [Armatimonadota bacterium]